jgi:DNA-binding protein H-NS
MKTLSTLQDKIENLIVLVKQLKAEKADFEKENKLLVKKLESMTNSIQSSEINLKELSKEQTHTKTVVEDLIKSIDVFVNAEQ